MPAVRSCQEVVLCVWEVHKRSDTRPSCWGMQEELRVKLSAEEARQAADELVRKAKEKKAKEDAELERLREQERIRWVDPISAHNCSRPSQKPPG